MGITGEMKIHGFAKRYVDWAERRLITAMEKIGDMCVEEAKANGNYQDRTFNLRDSITYAIIKKGEIIKAPRLTKTGNYGGLSQTELNNQNTEIIDRLALKNRDGIVLCVMAGMDYAVYVEAKNFNVLASADLLAQREARRILTELKAI